MSWYGQPLIKFYLIAVNWLLSIHILRIKRKLTLSENIASIQRKAFRFVDSLKSCRWASELFWQSYTVPTMLNKTKLSWSILSQTVFESSLSVSKALSYRKTPLIDSYVTVTAWTIAIVVHTKRSDYRCRRWSWYSSRIKWWNPQTRSRYVGSVKSAGIPINISVSASSIRVISYFVSIRFHLSIRDVAVIRVLKYVAERYCGSLSV
jgi:hypothetical protein